MICLASTQHPDLGDYAHVRSEPEAGADITNHASQSRQMLRALGFWQGPNNVVRFINILAHALVDQHESPRVF